MKFNLYKKNISVVNKNINVSSFWLTTSFMLSKSFFIRLNIINIENRETISHKNKKPAYAPTLL